MIDLQTLANDFADGIVAADAAAPIATSRRSRRAFQPGIGPHSEPQALDLVLAQMEAADPERYVQIEVGIPYPHEPRKKCDFMVGNGEDCLYVESKLLRILGDNGKPNDNMLMHILSPYETHRSALTDIRKLRDSQFHGRKAILIFGFEAEDWPLAPAIDAFEQLARAAGPLGPRHTAGYEGLIHPIHASGATYIWEVLPSW